MWWLKCLLVLYYDVVKNVLSHWNGYSPTGIGCEWILLVLTNRLMSLDGGGLESKASDDYRSITGAA